MNVKITTGKTLEEQEDARSAATAVLRMHGRAEVTINGKTVTLAQLRAQNQEARAALAMIKEGQRRLRKAKAGDVTVEVPPAVLNVVSK